MIVKALRVGLGQLIVFGDWISRPAKRKRDAAARPASSKRPRAWRCTSSTPARSASRHAAPCTV